MRAVILAAGRGSRLGPYTSDRPKCLVEVGGRSLLERQVGALRAAGAERIVVVTGWCHQAFTGPAARLGFSLLVNPRWAETTMVETLAVAEDWLTEGPTLVSYGDIVYSAATAADLAATEAPLAVSYDRNWRALWERRFADPLADAETFAVDPAGLVLEIGGRPEHLDQVQGQYLGLLRFTPEGWSHAARLRGQDPPVAHLTDLLGRIVRDGRLPVTGVPTDQPWFEFDHPSDLLLGREVLAALDAPAASPPLNGVLVNGVLA
ncbi:NTP transferase domain-containing protein [Kitasatospora sp. NPDC058063]|uniref:phosphocholine cytidylyltransferase family protein n=1 Tax=unclassified Kitasatospora TaxID=2633591 RepID=UPI0036DA197F